LIEKNVEFENFQEKTKGNIFDLEYSIEAVNKISNADGNLDVRVLDINEFYKSE
jgi:hypothetical protein